MENHDTENRRADRGSRIEGAIRVPGSDAEPEASDLVFDFSDLDRMRVQDLTVLLTARQMASEDDRTVWAAGVEMDTWRTLHAMGLGSYFKPFPTSDVREA